MPRAKSSVASRSRKKKILKMARGFRGGKSKLYKTAKEAVNRSLQYAYRDRRVRKREFRRLWIIRINAAARMYGMSYSVLMNKLNEAGVIIDRKNLSDLAVNDLLAFEKILKLVDEFELTKHKETIESIYDKFMHEGLYEYAGRFAAKCNL